MTITPEMRQRARAMVKSKLELWDNSSSLEAAVGFDVDTAGYELDLESVGGKHGA